MEMAVRHNYMKGTIDFPISILCCGHRSVPNWSKRRFDACNAFHFHNTETHLSAWKFFKGFFQLHGSGSVFISRAYDTFWHGSVFRMDEEKLIESKQIQASQHKESEIKFNSNKLNRLTRSFEDDHQKIDTLEYQTLKQELTLITAGVSAACSLYCLVVFSSEAAVSYGIGALGSILYLNLLYQYVDKLTVDNIANIFLRQQKKRLGIRSDDIQVTFQKALLGTGMAISSPRLLVPAALFGFWAFLHQYNVMLLKVELVPMMLGFFAYKGALFFQVYKDNKDLLVNFLEEESRI